MEELIHIQNFWQGRFIDKKAALQFEDCIFKTVIFH
jgi:hypothetical protein